MAVMTAKERKELYAKWDKVTLDDIIAMDEETYDKYRIYVVRKRRKDRELKSKKKLM